MALVVLVVGLLAVGSLSVAVVGESRRAAWRGAQSLVGDQLLGDALRRGFDGATRGRQRLSLRVEGAELEAERRVARTARRVLSIRVVVAGTRGVPADSYTTRLHRRAGIPGWVWEGVE